MNPRPVDLSGVLGSRVLRIRHINISGLGARSGSSTLFSIINPSLFLSSIPSHYPISSDSFHSHHPILLCLISRFSGILPYSLHIIPTSRFRPIFLHTIHLHSPSADSLSLSLPSNRPSFILHIVFFGSALLCVLAHLVISTSTASLVSSFRRSVGRCLILFRADSLYLPCMLPWGCRCRYS